MKTFLSRHILPPALLGLALVLATPAAMTADPAQPATSSPPATATASASAPAPASSAPASIPASTPITAPAPTTIKALTTTTTTALPPAPVAATAATPFTQARLLSVEVLQRYPLARRTAVQEALKIVFAGDQAYQSAFQQSNKPLSDQVVGPITLSFIARFWEYYNIAPVGSLTDASVDILLKFAGRLKARPDWRADLVSARFGRWIEQQPDWVELYRIRLAVDPLLLPAVLKRYRLAAPTRNSGIDSENAPLSVYWYGLTQQDLTALASRPVFAASLLKPLAPLTAYTYEAAADLADDVRAALKPSGQDATALLKQLDLIAKTDDGYALTDELLAQLGKETVLPPQLAKMFGDIVGMQYVRRSLFDQAMIQRLRIGLDPCHINLSTEEQIRRKARLLGKEDTDALRALVDAGSKAGPDTLGKRLQTLGDSGYCDRPTEENAVLAELYERYRLLIFPYVRKAPDYRQAKPFRLTTDLCGCNTDNMKGEVIHFLPFWLGGPPQQTDFSLMTRLNYYGITFDDGGELRMGTTGQRVADLFTGKNADQLAFINEARRHRVKVDWIVHRTDWAQWHKVPAKARHDILLRLAANIVHMLDTPMTDLGSTSIPWLTFGIGSRPVRGDGVTLYFDGYPADTESVTLYQDFLAELRRRLTDGGYALNIMLRHTEMGVGIHSYDRLAAIVPQDTKPDQPALYDWAEHSFKQAFGIDVEHVKPHYLVLLEEPTSEAKKRLRREVEEATVGEARAALLRRLVPVINFNGVAWPQLEDDLIYFDDNFGGIGFWPGAKAAPADAAKAAQPGVQRCGELKLVDDCLQDHFREPAGEAEPLACKFICSNRLPLRFTLDLLVLALAATVFAYVRWCDARPPIRKYYLAPVVALGVVVVIFAGLMTCDPFLNHLGDGLLVPGILVLAMIGMYFYFRSMLKERDARP